MAKRRKEKKTYKYQCSLTGQSYIVTDKAENPEELLSVRGWYEMHPEHDDRPEVVKKMLGPLPTDEETQESTPEPEPEQPA